MSHVKQNISRKVAIVQDQPVPAGVAQLGLILGVGQLFQEVCDRLGYTATPVEAAGIW